MCHSVHALAYRRLMAALLLAMLLTGFPLSAALAHAVIVRSDPPDGSVISKSPPQIRLWFSEAISAQLTQAQVLNVRGEAVPSTGAAGDPSHHTLLVVTVPELPDGIYNVVYTALSAADGHVTQGHIVFKVSAAGGGQAGDGSNSQPAVSFPEVVLRWLNFLSLAAVTGAVAVAFVLLKPDRLRDAGTVPVRLQLAQARQRVLKWGGWSALVALALGIALLLWQATLFVLPGGTTGGASTPVVGAALRLLGDAQFGTLWMCRQALLLVIAGLLFILAGRPVGIWPVRAPHGAGAILGLLSLAALTTQALSGHAAAVAPGTMIAVVIDVLHLAAAGLWVGGLLALAVGLLKPVLAGRGTPAFEALVHAGWRPFGGLAALSVGVLFATGLYSMGRQVASIDALVTTFYGRALIVKIALVMVVSFVGLLNSNLLHPAVGALLARLFGRPRDWTVLHLKRFPLLLAVELALGALVFLATGLITSAYPPHGPEFAPPPAVSGQVTTQQADDLLVTLQGVTPNQPGENIVTIRVADTRRLPPGHILRVIVHFTYQDQNVGSVTTDAQPVSPNVYQVAGDQLSLAGAWQIQAVVRRNGLEDSAAQFSWTVAGPGSQRPVVISNRPLALVLTVAAVTLLAVLVVAVLVWLRRPRPTVQNEGDARLKG
jgi:copper transport protein